MSVLFFWFLGSNFCYLDLWRITASPKSHFRRGMQIRCPMEVFFSQTFSSLSDGSLRRKTMLTFRLVKYWRQLYTVFLLPLSTVSTFWRQLSRVPRKRLIRTEKTAAVNQKNDHFLFAYRHLACSCGGERKVGA